VLCVFVHRHFLFAGLVNLSQIGLKLLIDRCGETLKHFVLQSSRISENVRCSAPLSSGLFVRCVLVV
jgi:hypothetical protein